MAHNTIDLIGITRAAQDGIGRKQMQIDSVGASFDQEDGSRRFVVEAKDGGIYVVNISTYKEPIR